MVNQIELASPARRKIADPAVMVIFGASGDLTGRKLVPSLYSLSLGGLMPEKFHVLGVARSEMSDETFAEKLKEGMAAFGRHKPRDLWPTFSQRLSYLAGGYDDPETYRRLTERLAEIDSAAGLPCNRLFYLAIPPTLYAEVISRLGEVGLNRAEGGWSRIIVEKPFGRDLASAHQLNEVIHQNFNESQVYRIDHYLGKETVQNILTFRFANSIFEPLWNRNYVDHIQISVLEKVGVGHRGGYYDHAGVIRDMFQNHLLQLLSLTAMEPPVAFNAKSLRDEKVKVLQAVPEAGWNDGVWGQYRGYLENPGVDPRSTTPTYLALRLYVNTWRWQGVPFYLRSGKNLAAKTTEIILQFKQVPHRLFESTKRMASNMLALCIQPDEGMRLQFQTKVPGAGMESEPVDMNFDYDAKFGTEGLPDAYERLLLDALQGDASLFARSDEIEEAWSIVDPLAKGWETLASAPMTYYEPGSWGPVEADQLMSEENRVWLPGPGGHE